MNLTGKQLEKRALALIVAVALIFATLAGQLGNLQFAQGAYWRQQADINRQRIVPVAAPRGIIYDRKGNVLATNKPSYTVTMMYLGDRMMKKTIPLLAQILAANDVAPDVQRKEQEIWSKFYYAKEKIGLYMPIKVETNVSPEVYTVIEERKTELPGVNVIVEPTRDYPDKSLAAHALGYVGDITEKQLKMDRYKTAYRPGDVVGQSGLENQYEEKLAGREGKKLVEVDSSGRWYRDLETRETVPGNNLVLTLDKDLQQASEEALKDQIEYIKSLKDPAANPTSAAVVVEDVRTGEILAMASYPSFDPNVFSGGIKLQDWKALISDPALPLMNWALQTFEPGSTYKMVTGTAGLEEGKIGPYETITCTGKYWLPPYPKCWQPEGHGSSNVTRALEVSCDIFFYETARRVGADTLAKYSRMFGFGQETGIDLPGEAAGLVPTVETYKKVFNRWDPGVVYSLGIGQGMNQMTPIQLANYAATIANGGTRYRPHLLKEVKTPDGSTVSTAAPEALDQLKVSRETLALIREGMLRVTQMGTSTSSFLSFPIKVGGKTGSAEAGFNPDGTAKPDNALFVGFAPYDNPEIAVSVVIVGGAHGSWAAPVGRAVFAKYFGIKEPKVKATNKSD